MKYFSIDYRSPPSGLGQIIDATQPEKILSPIGTEVYNFILVTYSGLGLENDPNYILTAHFRSREAEDQGWAGPVLEDVIRFLQNKEVTHVYDSELAYNNVGADSRGYFTLEKWAEIMSKFL